MAVGHADLMPYDLFETLLLGSGRPIVKPARHICRDKACARRRQDRQVPTSLVDNRPVTG
jgi:hypothetical protein